MEKSKVFPLQSRVEKLPIESQFYFMFNAEIPANEPPWGSFESYGRMEFIGFGSKALYALMEDSTDGQTLQELLFGHWQLPRPKLVINVAAGIRDRMVDERVMEEFGKGLMKAAIDTDAVVITGACHSGAIKYLGKAMREERNRHGHKATHKISTIGVTSWERTRNTDSLEGPHWIYPAKYNVNFKGDAEADKQKLFLDRNHRCFLFHDDRGRDKNTRIPQLHSTLVKSLTEQSIQEDMFDLLTPSILVVYAGGEVVLTIAANSLRDGAPALVVQDSGGAADVLAHAYKLMTEQQGAGIPSEDEPHQPLSFSKEVRSAVADMVRKCGVWRASSNCSVDDLVNVVEQCMKHMACITVLSAYDQHDIDRQILQGVLKAYCDDKLKQIQYALVWKRHDVICKDQDEDWADIDDSHLSDLLYYAMREDQPQFVNYFIENGVPLDILFARQYPLPLELTHKRGEIHDLQNMEQLLLHMVDVLGFGYSYEPLNDKPRQTHHTPPRCVREVFLWALLSGRLDLAEYLWTKTESPVTSAMLARKLLRHQSWGVRTQKSGQKQNKLPYAIDNSRAHSAHLVQIANKYEEFALGVMDECQLNNPSLTAELMFVRHMFYGNLNCVALAGINCRSVVAHPAMQEALNVIWYGGMSVKTTVAQVLLCMFLPFLIPIIHFPTITTETSHGKRPYESLANKTGGDMSDSQLVQEYDPPTKESACIRFCRNLVRFYHAGLTKYCWDVISWLLFLLLFSYVMLCDFHRHPSVIEYLLIVWVFALICEEIRQIIFIGDIRVTRRLGIYFCGYKWNIVDNVLILTFAVGMALRCIQDDNTFIVGKFILVTALFGYYIRLLALFNVHRTLGPKVVMIGGMILNLVFFILIMVVFIFGFGVATQSLLYPNSPLGMQLLQDVIVKPYWHMFGELDLETLRGETTCTNNATLWMSGDVARCPGNAWVGQLLLALYLIVAQILMINLLIAIFNDTYTDVKQEYDIIWKNQMYNLVFEYWDKPALAPPLNILSVAVLVIKFCVQKCMRKKHAMPTVGPAMSPEYHSFLCRFEQIHAAEYVRKRRERNHTK